MTPFPSLETRMLAASQPPELVVEYALMWQELWDVRRVKLGVNIFYMDRDLRTVVLGLLIDNTPVDTARKITLELMK